MGMVRQALASKRLGYIESMQCVSMVAQAVTTSLQQYLGDILGLMFDTGLSSSLTDCLTQLRRIPGRVLRSAIDELLMVMSTITCSG